MLRGSCPGSVLPSVTTPLPCWKPGMGDLSQSGSLWFLQPLLWKSLKVLLDKWGSLMMLSGFELSFLGPHSLISAEDFSPSGGPTAATLSIASWLPWKQVSRGICFSPSLNEEE